jgi:integrase
LGRCRLEQSSIRVFEGYSANRAGKPKSRKSRTLPMVDKVAHALGDLKDRSAHAAKDDLVFVGREGTHVDGSALRRRYHSTLDAAGLRRLRFHDLRHTFGSLAINVASIVQVQAWMGHTDIQTTMRYLHHESRADDAQLLSAAFRPKKKRKPAARRSTATKKRNTREPEQPRKQRHTPTC